MEYVEVKEVDMDDLTGRKHTSCRVDICQLVAEMKLTNEVPLMKNSLTA